MTRAAALLLFGSVVALAGCVARTERLDIPSRRDGPTPLVAVFPMENLAPRSAPLGDLRARLVDAVKRQGVAVLDDAALERVVTRHRVRFTAGVEAAFARALRAETGAEAILIPSLELYDEGRPPRVALFARLVSTGEAPAVRWIDGVGRAGDDAPGILGIGLVDDPQALFAGAADTLATSLARRLDDAVGADRPVPRKFAPKILYRSDAFDPARTWTIAVVPFFNRTARKYAGEIVALHMIRNLMALENLAVVEPGIVREELLRFRIIMTDGISLPDTDTVLGAVNADLVLNGEVLEYRDALGPTGAPAVDFSVAFIERRTRRVLFSSYSHATGADRVVFFDWGRVNTAHAMAARMARAIGDRLLERR